MDQAARSQNGDGAPARRLSDGEDAGRGAVDHTGAVYAGDAGTATHERLYVLDGSIVPRPLGVNPLLTISALAERSSGLIATSLGRNINYA